MAGSPHHSLRDGPDRHSDEYAHDYPHGDTHLHPDQYGIADPYGHSYIHPHRDIHTRVVKVGYNQVYERVSDPLTWMEDCPKNEHGRVFFPTMFVLF